MKHFLFLIISFFSLLPSMVYSQYCGAATTNVAITPTTTNQVTASYTSGRRAFNFAATAGCTYYFETCGLSTADTYLRLYSTSTGGTVLATGDDNCGTQSAITWTCSTNGTYSILMTNWSCAALTVSTALRYRITGCSTPFNPCSSITSLNCGVSTTFTVAAGNGAYNPPATTCGFSTPGQEKIYQFTPSITGNYTISQPTSFGYIDWFYKVASGGCSGTGWTCIDDISNTNLGNANVNIPLTAGVTYYIMGDPEGTTGGNVTFTLNCPIAPPANDLVCNATSISCGGTIAGTTVNATNSGTGETGSCGTSQTTAGVWYTILGNGQVMTASLCGTVWDSKISVYSGSNCSTLTCVGGNDDNGPACATTSSSYSWVSTPGINYYILVHGYSSTSAFSISITCVSPPLNNDCSSPTSLTVQCPGSTNTTSGTTLNATEDAIAKPTCDGVGTIQDVWYSFNTGNNTQVDITAALGTASWIGGQLFTSCGVVAVGPSVTCDFNLLTPNPTTITGLSMNTTYLLRIFTNSTYDTPGSFTIRLNTIDNTMALSSAASSQSVCVNTAMSNITFNTTGATGSTFSGLPPGISGSWSNNVVTISGSPTTSGTFNYTINSVGGCSTASSFGVITVIDLVPTLPAITGNSTITPNTSETYSITPVSGANYVWEFTESTTAPLWIVIPGSNSPSVTFTWPPSTTDGAVRVTVSNSCNSEQRVLLIITNSPLPVELMSFSGNCDKDRIIINWVTATEHNSQYYDLYKSRDGQLWSNISTVTAAGNSTQQLNYSIVDDSPYSGNNYYKLLQYDNDGESKEYGPINVNCKSDSYFEVFPNPNSGDFQVVLNDNKLLGEGGLVVSDEMGRPVVSKWIKIIPGINLYHISNTFEPGVYFVRVLANETESKVIKVIIK